MTGSLETHGLFLGDVNTAAPHNGKGNRENIRIMHLHEELLQQNGGSWDDPPEAVTWKEGNRSKRDEIVKEYPDDKLWGFKDPRTLLVLDGWIEAIRHAAMVGTFRHPYAVAESLRQRDGFDFERSYNLWAYYNEILIQYQEKLNFPLICYDWPEDLYNRKIKRTALNLGLKCSDNNTPTFFEARLRHHDVAADKPIPDSLNVLYKKMIDIANST